MSGQVQILHGLGFRPTPQAYVGTPEGANGSTVEAEVGDCFRASIASLIGARSLDGVPHFAHLRNVREAEAGEPCPWYEYRLAREWLRDRDLDLAGVDVVELDSLDIHYILTVNSHRGDWPHCVIARAGQVVFDPAYAPGDEPYEMGDIAHSVGDAICNPYEPAPAEQVAEWIAA